MATQDTRDMHDQSPATILVVDDVPQNVRLMEAVLLPRGYRVVAATSGTEALEQVAAQRPDLVLLDIVMPGLDGYDVCRRLRETPTTRFLPVVMVTASGEQEKVRAIEAGADDFVQKPVNQAELLARVRSLVRVQRYHETIERQAAELAAWNQTLEGRVRAQVEELERLGRLRRFLSPQLAEAILTSGDDAFLQGHRREISVVFCDLRGFTPFAETAEPEELMAVLRAYHAEMGRIVFEYGGTVGRFFGDGLLIFFNDPVPCPDHPQRAVRMAVAMRERMRELTAAWQRLGYDLGFGVGVAVGYATMGTLGFEGRWEYEPNGPVVNLAARLCSEAGDGQILIPQRLYAQVEDQIAAERLPDLALRGLSRPTAAYNVVAFNHHTAAGSHTALGSRAAPEACGEYGSPLAEGAGRG